MLYSDSKGISRFRENQDAQGAVPDGSLSGGTDEMLKSGRGLLRSVLLTALLATFLINPASAATLTTLGPGSRGEAVVTLKNELNEKGYYTVKNDTSDVYTSSLKSAVGVFQKANSIIPAKYGYADEQTQIRAASDDAILHSEYIEKQMDNQLQPGGSGDFVKKAQKQLTKLGYYTGKIDGRYRSSTVAAVKFFEKANLLVEDGIADKDTRTVLYSSDARTRAQYEDANFLTPLRLNSKGAQVAQLKTRLAELGFFWGEITENYDAQTMYSVKFFQEANGFTITGSASKTLREKINGGSCVTFAEYTKNMNLVQLSSGSKPGIRIAVLQRRLQELGYYKGVITGAYSSSVITAVRTFQIFNNMKSQYVTGKANTETRKLMLNETAKTYGDVCGDDTLKLGDSGDAVKKLQARLKELGYYTGEVDGVYDGAVASAVRVFQRYNGFYPSGVAYTDVQVKLYSASAVSYTNSKIEALIEVADKLMDAGARYSTHPNPPQSFDCSLFTAYCLRKVGIYVTAEVQSQGRSDIGKRITITGDKNYKELKRGDLLFFWSPDHKKKPGHAAIYLGNNKFIHASSGAGKVTVSSFKTYNERDGGPWFLWAIRIWE